MSIPMEGIDYYVYFIDLPPKIYACVVPNNDGTYTMYLDPRRDPITRIDDYEHELWHIIRDDFNNGDPIWVVEAA